MTKIELTDEEALLFVQFQKHHEIVAYIVGYLESMKMVDLKNASVQMDIDPNGIITHCAITKHFRR